MRCRASNIGCFSIVWLVSSEFGPRSLIFSSCIIISFILMLIIWSVSGKFLFWCWFFSCMVGVRSSFVLCWLRRSL